MPPQPLIALVDANNFYVSCERVFRPDLIGKPVAVLSNGDGCIVARSKEVKDLGIKMGVPLFQIQQLVNRHQIIKLLTFGTFIRQSDWGRALSAKSLLTPTSKNDQSKIRPFSGRLSCQDALHVESYLDSPTISSTNQRPYCFLDAEFLELVSVANNPGLRRIIAGRHE